MQGEVSKLKKLTGFAVGFFLLVNLQFPPGLDQGIRVTDYAGIAVWGVILLRLVSHYPMPRRRFFRGLFLFGVLALWLAVSLLSARTFIDPARWIIALGTAVGVLELLRSSLRPYVLRGIVFGGLAQFVVLLLQFFGFIDLTLSLGLMAPDIDLKNTVFGRWRPPGMYGTNATPAVAALAVPAGLALLDEGYGRKRWVILAVFATVATCTMTLTRSTILVITAVFVVWGAIKTNNVKRVGAAVAVLIVVSTVVAIVGPPGGWKRWEDASLESGNANIRIESTVGSVELALENPMGIGRERYPPLLDQRSGATATHNALTYVALAANLPLALYLLVYLAGRSITVFRQQTFESWLALLILGLCMWEEYFRNPVFITFGIIVVLSGVYQRHDERRPDKRKQDQAAE